MRWEMWGGRQGNMRTGRLRFYTGGSGELAAAAAGGQRSAHHLLAPQLLAQELDELGKPLPAVDLREGRQAGVGLSGSQAGRQAQQ